MPSGTGQAGRASKLKVPDEHATLISQGFDDLDRLVGRDIDLGPGVGGDTEEAFAYDALGRLTEATDDDSTLSAVGQMTYDSLSRVLTEAQGGNPLGDEAKTVSYAWDAESGRTLLTYPSGFEAHEIRDALGRLTAIEDASEATVAAFDLYGGGLREKKRTLANGTYAAVTYDGFRRPTEIAHKTSGNSQFAGFAYAWDKTDNPLMEARSHKSGTGDVYAYDAVNRLVRVLRDVDDPVAELADPGSEAYVQKLEYEMDDVFNLTAFKLTPYQGQTSTTNFTTDAMNQYTAVGNQSLTYTDAGSLEDDGTRSYVYDAHQHLIEVWERETQVAAYSYDALALGRRTAKTVGAATTRYVYAGQQSIEEWDGLDEEATLSRLFVFGERIDQIVAMQAPDQADVDADENTSEVLRFSYHTQLIGSVTHVTGPAGSVVESYEYDPYGAPTIRDAGGNSIGASAIGNTYMFTARQLDEETGLYYYRARHYSPELRGFIQRDPLEYVDGPNAGAYVAGRPTLAVDPWGLTRAIATHDTSAIGPRWTFTPSGVGSGPLALLPTPKRLISAMQDLDPEEVRLLEELHFWLAYQSFLCDEMQENKRRIGEIVKKIESGKELTDHEKQELDTLIKDQEALRREKKEADKAKKQAKDALEKHREKKDKEAEDRAKK